MRVLITGGGTAGHVNPALAIADIIQLKEPDSVIEYVGTEKGIEGRLVPKKGIKLHPITVRGLRRSLSPSNIKTVMMAMSARKKCKELIGDFKPDVVIGTGGYVCWPLISAAASMKVPTVLHESNAEPGFAVKMLKKQVNLILVNFEGTKDCLRDVKTAVERVGMPVNKDFIATASMRPHSHISGARENGAKESESKKKRILSFGGSLGAHTVNACALRLMKELATQDSNIIIEHACGTREYESVRAELIESGLDRLENIILSEYIYDMPAKMANADLVIARSGASTLAELAVAGKAALLIPSPNVTGDQQRKNAMQLVKKEAAVVLEDDVAVEQIVETVHSLLDDHNKLVKLGQNIRDFAFFDCDERIYSAIYKLVTKE